MGQRISIETDITKFRPIAPGEGKDDLDYDALMKVSEEMDKVVQKALSKQEGELLPRGNVKLYALDQDFLDVFMEQGRHQQTIDNNEPDLEIGNLRLKPPEMHQAVPTLVYDFDTGMPGINKSLSFKGPVYDCLQQLLEALEVELHREHVLQR